MSYFVLLSSFCLFGERQSGQNDEEQFVQLKKMSFVQFPFTICKFFFLTNQQQIVMSFLYDVPRYLSNCFKCLRISNITLHLPYLISIFLKIFKKTNSILCLKLFIYLFIIQILDQIMTIFTQYFLFFSKIFLNFFPFGIVLLVY